MEVYAQDQQLLCMHIVIDLAGDLAGPLYGGITCGQFNWFLETALHIVEVSECGEWLSISVPNFQLLLLVLRSALHGLTPILDKAFQCCVSEVVSLPILLQVHVDKGMKDGHKITFRGDSNQVRTVAKPATADPH